MKTALKMMILVSKLRVEKTYEEEDEEDEEFYDDMKNILDSYMVGHKEELLTKLIQRIKGEDNER